MLEHGISLLVLTGTSWVYASGLWVSLKSPNKLQPEFKLKVHMPGDFNICKLFHLKSKILVETEQVNFRKAECRGRSGAYFVSHSEFSLLFFIAQFSESLFS